MEILVNAKYIDIQKRPTGGSLIYKEFQFLFICSIGFKLIVSRTLLFYTTPHCRIKIYGYHS